MHESYIFLSQPKLDFVTGCCGYNLKIEISEHLEDVLLTYEFVSTLNEEKNYINMKKNTIMIIIVMPRSLKKTMESRVNGQ